MKLLEKTTILMQEKGYEINNIDCTVLLEKPILAPFILEMRENLATVLKTEASLINVKATRGEKLGFIGRQEGIMAQAVVLLERK